MVRDQREKGTLRNNDPNNYNLIEFQARSQNFEKDNWLRQVGQSDRTEQLGCHRADFLKMLYLSVFRKKTVDKSQISLESDKNKGYCT